MTFGPWASVTLGAELAAADLGGLALDADARAGRAHACRGPASVAPWTTAVSTGREIWSCTGFCGLGGGASAPQPPRRAPAQPAAIKGPSRIVPSQATARLESVLGERYCVEHMFVRVLSQLTR